MRSRIALRLLAFFAAALLLFAGVSSLLFRSLFARAVTDSKRQEMLTRATGMAQTLGQAMDGTRHGGGGPGGQGGLAGYVRLMTQLQPNVWVLDERMQVLSGGRMADRSFAYDKLPPDAGRLVQQVFEGQSPFSEGFSELVGYPTLTVGVPIYRGQQVIGALLLYDAVSGIEDAARQGQRLLIYSVAAALLLAILLAWRLSYQFTRPISRIRTTALRLAQGDYQAKTGLQQRDEIGELGGAVDELSERLEEARRMAQQEDQRRKDFLANVSHELRTPVTVLRASLEAIEDGVVTNQADLSAYNQQMLNEIKGLQRLVNDLMELARLQNDGFPIDREALVLQEVVMDALRGAERLAESKQITLLREMPSHPLPFEGDYARLKQMLLIVLDNAIKFSKPASSVRVLVSDGLLQVADQGVGISPEELPHVFDRFRKSRSEENRQGSGLGLAIAREIAQRHGMRMTMTSELQQGTTVSFRWESSQA